MLDQYLSVLGEGTGGEMGNLGVCIHQPCHKQQFGARERGMGGAKNTQGAGLKGLKFRCWRNQHLSGSATGPKQQDGQTAGTLGGAVKFTIVRFDPDP